MKTKKLQQKNIRILIRSILIVLIILSPALNSMNAANACAPPPSSLTPEQSKKVKIALLLDTSNSMDGLIDQAKAQLWKLVNELAMVKCDNTRAALQIALYEYGNDNLPASEGYIRMVTPLTNDLDKISEDLFSLTTQGGSEFCGEVIQTATRQLDWSAAKDDMQIVFIAGNEAFTQGKTNYKDACVNANEKNIIVNTIFCGDYNEGIRSGWKDGATLTNGAYMSIEHNRKTIYIESPYDDKITELNELLNKTYLPYGIHGSAKYENQATQDNNSMLYGKVNTVQRVVSKSTHVYDNKSWDLVDASKEESFDISKINNEDLPENMQSMSADEKSALIEKRKEQRDKIKDLIQTYNKKRTSYVAEKQKNRAKESTLDNAMIDAIHDQAGRKNYVFE